MANLRAIRTRIKSVENTQQITKSMKMVAAAKLRRTQTAFGALRDFADHCAGLLARVSAAGVSPSLPPSFAQAVKANADSAITSTMAIAVLNLLDIIILLII